MTKHALSCYCVECVTGRKRIPSAAELPTIVRDLLERVEKLEADLRRAQYTTDSIDQSGEPTVVYTIEIDMTKPA